MEIQNPQQTILELLKSSEIASVFTEAELQRTADEMISVVREVLGQNEIATISFHDDNEMFFELNTKNIHFGLGIIQKMIATWEKLLNPESTAYLPRDMLRETVISSLRGDAAHEAGHRVIDRNPMTEIGIPKEVWGKLGLSALANALMDCRDDGRIMVQEPHLKPDMDAALAFSFGPGGRLDWLSEKDKQMLRMGYPVLFTQFDSEAIRTWAYHAQHPETDPRVKKCLGSNTADMVVISQDNSCVPKRNPSELEVRTKAQIAYRTILKIYDNGYQELVQRDHDNQAIHQAISILGIHDLKTVALPKKLQDFLDKQMQTLSPELKAELAQKLEGQKAQKRLSDAIHHPVESTTQSAKDAAADLSIETQKKEDTKDYFDILGPAILVEELSDPLREFLKDLFKEMMELMQEEIAQQMIQQFLQALLKDPEKVLKEIEDAFNEKVRPHTAPPTVPTHAEIEKADAALPESSPTLKIDPGGGLSPSMIHAEFPVERDFEEVERWLEEHLDMQERITAWREAIFSMRSGGKSKTNKPSPKIDTRAMVQDVIRKEQGIMQEGKLFLEKAREREKITLSVLWRTQAVDLKEALKLILFLKKIYEDDEIRKYLDLEILVSQEIKGVSDHDETSGIPVILRFGQDPIRDYDAILSNLKALQKAGSGDAALTITEDATALKTQREQLLNRNPGSRRKFSIDIWDEAAVQRGVSDPMRAVKEEIQRSQKDLHGKAFCIVLKKHGASSQTPAEAYGKDHFLVSTSAEDLIRYLDVVVRTMIKYHDDYSLRVRETLEQELGIVLP